MNSTEEHKKIIDLHITHMIENMEDEDTTTPPPVDTTTPPPIEAKPKKKDTRQRSEARKAYMAAYYASNRDKIIKRSLQRYTPKKKKSDL